MAENVLLDGQRYTLFFLEDRENCQAQFIPASGDESGMHKTLYIPRMGESSVTRHELDKLLAELNLIRNYTE